MYDCLTETQQETKTQLETLEHSHQARGELFWNYDREASDMKASDASLSFFNKSLTDNQVTPESSGVWGLPVGWLSYYTSSSQLLKNNGANSRWNQI